MRNVSNIEKETYVSWFPVTGNPLTQVCKFYFLSIILKPSPFIFRKHIISYLVKR